MRRVVHVLKAKQMPSSLIVATQHGNLQAKNRAIVNRGAFRTLRLARDCVRKGQGFWWDGGWTCKNGEVGQWIAD